MGSGMSQHKNDRRIPVDGGSIKSNPLDRCVFEPNQKRCVVSDLQTLAKEQIEMMLEVIINSKAHDKHQTERRGANNKSKSHVRCTRPNRWKIRTRRVDAQ
jgi:hypothetical protein